MTPDPLERPVTATYTRPSLTKIRSGPMSR